MGGELMISGEHLSLSLVKDLLAEGNSIHLDDLARQNVSDCRNFLDDKIADPNALYYGISTGFGSQYHVRIDQQQMEELQMNLIMSHAAGTGDTIPREVSKIIVLLKILSLTKGHSGVRLQLVDRLVHYFNHDMIPVMYKFGSLGASGDLAPLAHMSLTLLGKGSFYSDDGTVPAADLLEEKGLKPMVLEAKEGLALINGTQFSTGFGVWSLIEAQKLLKWASAIAALSLEGFDCNLSPFDERIQEVRIHQGQSRVAGHIRALLDDSGISRRTNKHLQDPYAFRCIPQVHGASCDIMDYASNTLESEANAVTDNPLIFPESDSIISGGNFHAQPVALLLDYMAMAISELANISERRSYQLLSGNRDLPSCLVQNAGLHSGLMISQYTAASIVNRNKILCTPASVDSIPSSMGQEDHVSMGANSATKLYEVVNNTRSVLAIELLCAAQAVELKGYQSDLSGPLNKIFSSYREKVPFIENDMVLHDLMGNTEKFLSEFNIDEVVT